MQDGFFQPVESFIFFFGIYVLFFIQEIPKFFPTLTVLSHIYALQVK